MSEDLSWRRFIQGSAAAVGAAAMSNNVLADALEQGDTLAGQGAQPKVSAKIFAAGYPPTILNCN